MARGGLRHGSKRCKKVSNPLPLISPYSLRKGERVIRHSGASRNPVKFDGSCGISCKAGLDSLFRGNDTRGLKR